MSLRFSLDDVYLVLGQTPEILRAWLAELPAQLLHANEGADTFSPFEILGHLIHGEEVDWIPRARIILEHGPARAFEPFDRFAHRRLYADKDVGELLESFDVRRRENLDTLRAWDLTPEQLDLEGRHPELGAVTMRQLIATWVVHDLNHLAQLSRVLAKQYAGDVGVWREYLPILRPRVGD